MCIIYLYLGKTYLTEMINLPSGLPIDYMHLICLGIFKKIMFFWFDKSNNKKPYYLGMHLLFFCFDFNNFKYVHF